MQIIVQNLLTNYSRQGSGNIVLLIHGWADSLSTFDLLSKKLANNYDVVRLDLPGFGKSQAPNVAWDLSNYANFLHDFLEKLNIGLPYAIIGHSNGGALAIHALAKHKLTADKLVLISASGVRNRGLAKRNATKLVAKTGKLMTLWLPINIRQKLQKKLYGTIGSDLLVAPHMQETFKQTVRQDIQKEASKLALNTMLIYGSDDRATSIKTVGKRLLNLIPRSKLVVIDGADHFAHQTHHDQVNKIIIEFIK